MDLLRATTAEFPTDAELSKLEMLAQEGINRKAEADRLITASQELFAQQKPAEAIQLLRQAYDLDKNNTLARTILANALVEHAQSMVETNWLEAEKLTNQALGLNPAHPTAKTILSRIVDRKQTSSVEDWVSQAGKLHSCGDLFGALAWVAEGLAVHPNDSKLLQAQDAIQRDQAARRRQDRRCDLEDLRRMGQEIAGAADAAGKEALAERIQVVAAKYWTDGEILGIANALLLRLGLVPRQSATSSPPKKGAALIFHVPRPAASKASSSDARQITRDPVVPKPDAPTDASANRVSRNQVLPSQTGASQVLPSPIPPGIVPDSVVPPPKIPAGVLVTPKVPASAAAPAVARATVATAPPARPSGPAKVTSRPSRPKEPTTSNSTMVIVVSAAAIILVAATFFFTRRHYAARPIGNIDAAAAPVAAREASAPIVAAPTVAAPSLSTPIQTNPVPSEPALPASPDTAVERVTHNDQPPVETVHNEGALLVVAGQENARVFLDGKLQRQLTHAGQLRIPNLEPKDYVVQVSKDGFQDPAQQTIRIRKGELAKLTFNLQPEPRLASLRIQGGAPGTTVLVDEIAVGTVQSDGTFSASTVSPGDHSVELRKERFKTRQFKKHFVAGGTISLATADAALETSPGELKISFTPATANVAIVKGDFLKMVSSGVPLNLAPGTYTITARTADRFSRSSTLEVIAGQSKALDLSLAPNGMSKWEDPGAWKPEKDSFVRKGGNFVLYGVVPASGTFAFSATAIKGHVLQWVLNYSDPKNYILFQIDENNFYRCVIRNGQRTDEIIIPHIADKKSSRTLRIRVSPTEIVHQIEQGDSWRVVDRWTQPGANLSQGKFGFYIPGNDQVALSGFTHYADLNIR